MELFVFPLGHFVFYPYTSKPLTVYEPRYLQMVKDAVETGTSIAVGYVDEPEHSYQYQFGKPLSFTRSVVGYGHAVIHEQRADGSLLILLQGLGKAKIGNVLDKGVPYIVCEAESIQENNQVDREHLTSYLTLQKILFQWLAHHFPDPQHREMLMKNLRTAHEVLGTYSSYLVADRDIQQMILEMNDINEKIDILSGLVVSAYARI